MSVLYNHLLANPVSSSLSTVATMDSETVADEWNRLSISSTGFFDHIMGLMASTWTNDFKTELSRLEARDHDLGISTTSDLGVSTSSDPPQSDTTQEDNRDDDESSSSTDDNLIKFSENFNGCEKEGVFYDSRRRKEYGCNKDEKMTSKDNRRHGRTEIYDDVFVTDDRVLLSVSLSFASVHKSLVTLEPIKMY